MNRKLHFGCSINVLPEPWENFDLDAENLSKRDARIRFADITQPLRQFPDCCAAAVFHEHLIEHVTGPQALHFLQECHRILAPEGTIRVCFPEIRKALTREHAIDLATNHGHLQVLNHSVMELLLWMAGFVNIGRCDRADIDGHWKIITREKDNLETCRMCAVK